MPAAACELSSFKTPVRLDWEALVNQVILRKGTPRRTFFMELFLDGEVTEAVDQRFGISAGQRLRIDPHFAKKRLIAVYRFLGYDTVPVGVEGSGLNLNWDNAADTTPELARAAGRNWMNEHAGPITSWEDFEKYPWPESESLIPRTWNGTPKTCRTICASAAGAALSANIVLALRLRNFVLCPLRPARPGAGGKRKDRTTGIADSEDSHERAAGEDHVGLGRYGLQDRPVDFAPGHARTGAGGP